MNIKTDGPTLLGALISQYLYDEFCGEWDFDFGGQKYELVGDEDYAALGYTFDPEDPCGQLVIRRMSDGKCFEVDLEATVRPVPARAQGAAA